MTPWTKTLLFAVTLGCALRLNAAELPGADSPEGVVKGVQAAAEAGDRAAIYNWIEPEFRRRFAAFKLTMMIVGIDFMDLGAAPQSRETAEAAKRRQALSDLLEETGAAPGTRLSELGNQAALAALMERVDQGRLIAALDDLHLAFYPTSFLPPLPLEKAEVTDYQIQGDRATAKAGDHVVEFIRVAGRWYFTLPDTYLTWFQCAN